MVPDPAKAHYLVQLLPPTLLLRLATSATSHTNQQSCRLRGLGGLYCCSFLTLGKQSIQGIKRAGLLLGGL